VDTEGESTRDAGAAISHFTPPRVNKKICRIMKKQKDRQLRPKKQALSPVGGGYLKRKRDYTDEVRMQRGSRLHKVGQQKTARRWQGATKKPLNLARGENHP